MKFQQFLKIIVLIFTTLFISCKNETNIFEAFARKPKEIQHLKKLLRQQKTEAKEIDFYFADLFKNKNVNGAILVAQNDHIIYENAHGYSNYETKELLTVHSSFQLASVSKQFTAVAILMLYERGLLNLTDSVQKFFPNFPYHNITIHQLLCHRSGLPAYTYFCENFTDRKTPIDAADVLKIMIEKQPQRYYPPDFKYTYSNTGYMLLSEIVAKVSGKSFSDFLNDSIFKPLGMKNTFLYSEKNSNLPSNVELTTGYHSDWSEAYRTYQDGVFGDKGVYSSAEDLFRWDLALNNGLLLLPETLELAYTPHNKELSNEENYGYGWRISITESGEKMVFHGGWWRGYTSLMVRFPEKKTFVVILCNKMNRSFQINYHNLLHIFFPEDFNLMNDSLVGVSD